DPSGALGPEWTIVEQNGRPVGWYNGHVGGVIQASETCKKNDVSGLEALTKALLVGYTDVHRRSSEPGRLGGRDALHSLVDVKLDGVPMTLDLYVVKRNDCVYDLVYAAPPEQAGAGRADFRRFVAGYFRGRT